MQAPLASADCRRGPGGKRVKGGFAKARGTSAATSTTRASRVVRGFARTRRRAAGRRYNRPLFAIAKDKAPGPRVVCEPARKRSRAAHRATQGQSGRRPGVRAYRARQGELRERERARVPPRGAGEWQAERPLQGRRPWSASRSVSLREKMRAVFGAQTPGSHCVATALPALLFEILVMEPSG